MSLAVPILQHLGGNLYLFGFVSLENTTIPNITEVKENMTLGTTLVTNPNGGFLVRIHLENACSHFNDFSFIFVFWSKAE